VAADACQVKANTFVFADLAGFTALTEAHGDALASKIADDFVTAVRQILASYEAEEVKTIGDEVMIRTADAGTAVRIGLEIVDQLAFNGSPPVRVGIHTGPAIHRNHDWFGSTVNVASRVTDAAKPGEVLLTDATRSALTGSFELEARGERYFKHIPELVPVYGVARLDSATDQLEIDPVCRMAVSIGGADSRKRRRGITYYFCSADCRQRFDQDPRRYVALSPGARAARLGFLINLVAFLAIGGAHLLVWAGRNFSSPSVPMLILFAGWAVALVVHYRLVRETL
jgi:class 3 adenylate cyclase